MPAVGRGRWQLPVVFLQMVEARVWQLTVRALLRFSFFIKFCQLVITLFFLQMVEARVWQLIVSALLRIYFPSDSANW
jgi:hypothetical protein